MLLSLPPLSDASSPKDALDPAGWTLGCQGADLRAGAAEAGSNGESALEVSCADAPVVLLQDLPDPEALRSRNFRFEVWVRCATPGAVRLSVDDGVTDHQWTDRSTGSSDWELLSIDGIVSHRGTRLRAQIHIAPGAQALLRGGRLDTEWVDALCDPALDDLTEDVPDRELPLLDRRTVDESRLSERQRFWRENGFLILPRLLPDALVDAYCRAREKISSPWGYDTVNPYHQVEEIKQLCLYRPLMEILEELVGEPMGMHLNLTGWISTERSWHQDDYLNPPSVNNHYAAVWFALDEISPDAGPFEYIPGSHRWFTLRRDKVLRYVPPEERTGEWPKTSERFLVPLVEREIARRDGKPLQFLGGKGDVLIWNGHLVHRGTPPRDKSLLRKAIITHYSSIHRRKDAPTPNLYQDQGYFF